MEILVTMLLHVTSMDAGKLSFYWPGDGFNAGKLSCGGAFTHDMEHIAYRGWRRVGCGRPVLVCSEASLTCALSRVRDAGPFGIVHGRRWQVHTGTRPPSGWRWRAAADLSLGLWQHLDRPASLSRVYLVFLPRPAISLYRLVQDVVRRWMNPLLALAR